ncbi:MAG: hypothetical protein P8184_18120 [Calditrichia bacterium]
MPDRFMLLLFRIRKLLRRTKYHDIVIPELAHESDSFILIEWKERGIWLQKSEITIEKSGEEMVLHVPDFLFWKMKKLAGH